MKIIVKLSLVFLTIALLVLIGGYISTISSRKVFLKHINETSIQSAENIMEKVDQEINSQIEELQNYSRDVLLRQALEVSNQEFEQLDDVPTYIKRTDQEWASIPEGTTTSLMQKVMKEPLSDELREKRDFYETVVTNRYGVTIAQAGRPSEYYQADKVWWQDVVRDGVYVGDVVFNKSDNKGFLDIAVKVVDQQQEFLGVIFAVLDVRAVSNVFQDLESRPMKEHQSEHFMLINKEGKILYKKGVLNLGGDLPVEILSHLNKDIPVGQHFFILYEEGEGAELFVWAPSKGYRNFKGLGWTLMVEYEAEEIFAPVNKLGDFFLLLSLGGMGLAILIGLYISRLISSPITELKEAAVRVKDGDLDVKINVKTGDEIEACAVSFNRMVETLKGQRAQLVDKNFLDSILHNMIEPLIVTDAEGKIKMVNVATLEFLGYAKGELEGASVNKILAGVGDAVFTHASFVSLFRVGYLRGYEINYISRQGEELPVSLSAAVMYAGDSEKVLVGSNREVTGIVLAARSMKQINELISSLELSKRDLENTNFEIEQAKAEVEKGSKGLEANVKKRTAQLSVLYEVSNAIAYTSDIPELLRIVMESLFKIVQYDICTAVLLTDKTIEILIRPSYSESMKYIEQVKEVALNSVAMFTHETICGENVKTNVLPVDSNVDMEEKTEFGNLKSSFTAPLLINGKIVGMLNLSSARGNIFQENEVKFIYTVANQVSSTLEHLRSLMSEEQSKMEILVENMLEGALMLDNSNQILVMNSQAKDMLGFDEGQEVIKAELLERFKYIRLDEAIGECRHQDCLVTREAAMPRDPKRTLRFDVTPIKAASAQSGVAVTFRDITKEKEVDLMKTEFISTVSHELRTPLSITKEGLSLVLDKIVGDITEKQEVILTTARDNIDRLARLINNLLDVSKIEAGKLDIKRERISVSELIAKVVASFELKMKKKKLDLRVNFPNEPIEVFGDYDKLIQVFTNLINNALKFTIEGYIEVSCNLDGDYVVFTVADTGIGIAKGDLSRTFMKFQQFGRIPGDGEKGTGLGLMIVKGIVEMHGGKIWVESKLGEGTKFMFTFQRFSSELPVREFVRENITQAQKVDVSVSLLQIVFEVNKGISRNVFSESWDKHSEKIDEVIKAALHRQGDSVYWDGQKCYIALVNCSRLNVSGIRERIMKVLQGYLAQTQLNDIFVLEAGYATYPDDGKNAIAMLSKIKNVMIRI